MTQTRPDSRAVAEDVEPLTRQDSTAETIDPIYQDNADDEDGHFDPQSSNPSSASIGKNNPPSRPGWRRWLSKSVSLMWDQWFVFALGLIILLCSQVQVPGPQQELKTILVTYLCVAVIFFITGCTLSTEVLMANFKRWKIHIFVQLQSFLIASIIIFGIVSITAINPNFMDSGLLVGMVFSGCLPTTISSNIIMTKQAKGNQALTVVESTLGNFLGPFISPLLLLMYMSTGAWYTAILPGLGSGGYSEMYRRVFKQLGLSIFLPIFVGQVLQKKFPNATRKVFAGWKLSKLNPWALLLIIWQTFDQAFQTGAFNDVPASNIIFVVFISITIYFLLTMVCVLLSKIWLSKADTIAVAYIVPAKTPAMGVPLTNVMFANLPPIVASKIQVSMILYQDLQVVVGSVMTLVFRKWIMDELDRKQQDEERPRWQKDQPRIFQTEHNGNGSTR